MEDKRLKGVNLGGWLLMEGYILGGRNISESIFKEAFRKSNGGAALYEFTRIFRENFIQEEDFKNIALLGANCIRLPFNYRIITKEYSVPDGLMYFKKVFTLANKYNLGIILDLHAAPGAQNCDWHSDSAGKAMFWEKEKFRKETLNIWDELISEFKEEPALIGFDVINEPVLGQRPTHILVDFYKEAIRRIKVIDNKHTIFLEGDIWAQRIDFLQELIEENVAISIHTYQPLNYTFNFTPFYNFPGDIDGALWDEKQIIKYLEPYYRFSQANRTRIFVGEFGINWRGGFYGELQYLESIFGAFETFGFDYAYWTYKAVAGGVFPDGIYQYLPNSNYVKREGPIFGWENYIPAWKKEKEEITNFWQTKNYIPNQKLISVLRRFFQE